MSISRIIVGVDGRPGGADALALARDLTSAKTELIAVSVAVLDAQRLPIIDPDGEDAARRAAQHRLDEIREQHADVRGEISVAYSPAAGLHSAAERLDAGLIVVGSCHRGRVDRIFAGDDTLATLRGAPCPVAVAPQAYALRDGPITTIGLGWNAGDDADVALEFVRTLSRDLGAEAQGLAVVGLPPWPVAGGTTTGAAIADEVAVLAGRALALEDFDITTVAGVTADELERFAAEVDVLVVGSRQRGLLARVVFGSTSEALARSCVRPLIVVPRISADAR